MRWDGLAGNLSAKKTLSGFVDAGRLPHALLIEGPPGSGRRSFALRMAQAAVCLAAEEKPCGVCAGCHKALADTHPDIMRAGGSGGARSFHVDAIRAIRETAYILPNEAPRRVILLEQAENMTDTAQNALLKILEEPPGHVLFILTCENRSQLLPTIQSRAVCIALGAVEEDEGWLVIRERLPEVAEEDARQALRLFGGLIGRALEGLQEGRLTQVVEQTAALADRIVQPEELPLLQWTAGLDKDLWDGVLRGLQLAARDALAAGVGSPGREAPSPRAAERLSKGLTRQQLMRLIDTIQELIRARERYMNPTLFSVVAAARLREAAGR